MNWTTAKKDSDLVLPGVEIQTERRDGYIAAVTLTAGGKALRFANTGYSIDAYVPAPPKSVKMHRVAGKLDGLIPVDRTFDTFIEADGFLKELRARSTAQSDEDCGVALSEIEVFEQQA
jgi:hypothetical protein